jgi:hypothetical protein
VRQEALMRRDEWLASLKAGDKVMVVSHEEADPAEVLRRTPAGAFVVKMWGINRRFDKHGRGDDYANLYPVTQEQIDKVEARRIATALIQADYKAWRALPLETLRQIHDKLKEVTSE